MALTVWAWETRKHPCLHPGRPDPPGGLPNAMEADTDTGPSNGTEKPSRETFISLGHDSGTNEQKKRSPLPPRAARPAG